MSVRRKKKRNTRKKYQDHGFLQLSALFLSLIVMTFASCASIFKDVDEPTRKNISIVCPPGMKYVYNTKKRAKFCVDQYELSLTTKSNLGVKIEERLPSPHLNYYQCKQICKRQGKRMLSHREWVLACEGTPVTKCNRYQPHPVARMMKRSQWIYKGVNCKKRRNSFTEHCMNDPRLIKLSFSLAKNNQYKECVSKFGVANMVGNLGEWVSTKHRRRGRIKGRFNGGLFPQPRSSCNYSTIAHGPEYRDYSIGCRCAKSLPGHRYR